MAKRKNIFKDPQFTNEKAARAWFEGARWPDGPVCPNCGSLKHYATKKLGRYRCGESRLYIGVGKEFSSHETVRHSHGEYVRGDVHTNTIENYFSVFKRGMRGT